MLLAKLQHLYMLGGRNGNVALRDFWRYSIGKYSLLQKPYSTNIQQMFNIGK